MGKHFDFIYKEAVAAPPHAVVTNLSVLSYETVKQRIEEKRRRKPHKQGSSGAVLHFYLLLSRINAPVMLPRHRDKRGKMKASEQQPQDCGVSEQKPEQVASTC